jgi:hypothetical protein
MKLNPIVDKVKTTFKQAAAQVKERISAVTDTSSTTIQQLADYVRHHSETKRMDRTLLGITYSFYHLEKEGIQYDLETRGSTILQLDVHNITGQKIVSYRSYRDHLNTTIKIPESLLDHS